MEKSIKSVENTIVVQLTFFLHNFWRYHAYHHMTAWVRAKAKTLYIKRNLTNPTLPPERGERLSVHLTDIANKIV